MNVSVGVVETIAVCNTTDVVSSVPFSHVLYSESTHIGAVTLCHQHIFVGTGQRDVSLVTDTHCAVTGGVDTPQPLKQQQTHLDCPQTCI